MEQLQQLRGQIGDMKRSASLLITNTHQFAISIFIQDILSMLFYPSPPPPSPLWQLLILANGSVFFMQYHMRR